MESILYTPTIFQWQWDWEKTTQEGVEVEEEDTKEKNKSTNIQVIFWKTTSTQLDRHELNWIKPGQEKNKHNEQATKHILVSTMSHSQSFKSIGFITASVTLLVMMAPIHVVDCTYVVWLILFSYRFEKFWPDCVLQQRNGEERERVWERKTLKSYAQPNRAHWIFILQYINI